MQNKLNKLRTKKEFFKKERLYVHMFTHMQTYIHTLVYYFLKKFIDDFFCKWHKACPCFIILHKTFLS